MTATVNVRLNYQPHCPDCMKQVEETIASAIRDTSVAGVSMVAAKRCEHDALAVPRLDSQTKPASTGRAAAAPPPPTGMAILPYLDASAPNGFDPAIQ